MAALAELVDHVIGVDPDRDRVTAAVVSVTTQGELASATFPATRRGYGSGQTPSTRQQVVGSVIVEVLAIR